MMRLSGNYMDSESEILSLGDLMAEEAMGRPMFMQGVILPLLPLSNKPLRGPPLNAQARFQAAYLPRLDLLQF
jgi:hypothetical protein